MTDRESRPRLAQITSRRDGDKMTFDIRTWICMCCLGWVDKDDDRLVRYDDGSYICPHCAALCEPSENDES